MFSKEEYNKARLIVKLYEEVNDLYNIEGGIPFSEYENFKTWMDMNGWYEAATGEYDNSKEPNSCFRLNIKELYSEFIRR